MYRNKKFIVSSIIIVVLITLITVFSILWFKRFKFEFFPRNFGVVTAGKIYRSGRLSDNVMEKTLLKYNIKQIINLTGSRNFPRTLFETKITDKLKIKVNYYNLGGDGTGNIQKYVLALKNLFYSQKENRPVLIHCAAGTNRTGGIIAVYRLLIEKKSPKDVYKEMVAYGFRPSHNTTLIPFLNKNMEYFAQELKKEGIIKEMPSKLPVLSTQ